MKAKKFTKSLFVTATVALLLVVAMFLTACSESLSVKEAIEAYSSAAKTYYKSHEDYDNFENSTYTITVSSDSNSTQELEYKKNATDTEFTKESFTTTYTQNATYTISFKNVKANETNNIAVTLVVDSTTNSTSYTTDEDDDTLKTVTEKLTSKTTYTLTPVVDEQTITYYLAKETKTQSNNEEAEVTKSVKAFDDRDEYKGIVNTLIEAVCESVVKNGFFTLFNNTEMSMMLLPTAQITKDGNKIETVVELNSFSIWGTGVVDSSATMTSKIVDNKVNSSSVKATMYSDEGLMTMSFDFNVAYTANGNINTDFTDYTEDEFLEIAENDIPGFDDDFSL